MKRIFSIVAIILALILVIFFAKDQIVKSIVTTMGSNIIGAPLRIDSISAGLLSQSIFMSGVKLYNPTGFPKEVMVEIPQLNVDYDVWSIFKGKIHVRMALMNLRQLTVIRNKEGKFNVDSLKVVKEQKRAIAEAKKKGELIKNVSIQIDQVKLSVGVAVFKNFYTDSPSLNTVKVDLKEKTFTDITSVEKFVVLVLLESIKPVAIKMATAYGTANILGMNLIPAGVVATLLGEDSTRAYFDIVYDKVYKACLAFLKDKGNVIDEKKDSGIIKAKIEGIDVTIKIMKETPKTSALEISAKKLFIPQPQFAGELLYQITQKLK